MSSSCGDSWLRNGRKSFHWARTKAVKGPETKQEAPPEAEVRPQKYVPMGLRAARRMGGAGGGGAVGINSEAQFPTLGGAPKR